MSRLQRIVNVSGGKDSTAVYLKMIERGKPFRAVFADTQHEADQTYEFVARLAERTGGPKVETVRADFTKDFEVRRANLPGRWRKDGVPEERIERALAVMYPTGNVFLDLCLLRSGFPSAKRRYCTEYLKLYPVTDQVLKPIYDSGLIGVSVLGVRADESRNRSLAAPMERKTYRHVKSLIWRPILSWTVQDVMNIHAKHGLKPNPLYSFGLSRVGCLPCIFAQKAELRILAKRCPEGIERVAEWERIVEEASKSGGATFYPARDLGAGGPPWHHSKHGIHTAVDWSKTAHGGRKYLLDVFNDDGEAQRAFNTACVAQGMCE